jgi:hypothetical protein
MENITSITNTTTTPEIKNSQIALDPSNFMIFYKYLVASGFTVASLYLNQLVNLEKCNISSVQRDAMLFQLTLL